MSDLTFSLLPWQQVVINDPARFRVVCAGRRCGKSRLSAVMLLIKALQAPKGSGVIYVAPTAGQARVIIWQLLMDLGREVIASAHVNNMEFTLVNGTVIYVRGADRPDTLRGMSLYFAVLDEYASMKPSAWEEVIRAALSDHKGEALFIGSPVGRNHFYDLHQLGVDGSDPQWKSFHYTTADNPLIDPNEIAAAKRSMSSFAFRQEYLASFTNSGTAIFNEDWFLYGVAPKQYDCYMAVDLAGFESSSAKSSSLDRTAIAVIFASDDGKIFVRKIESGRWNTREAALRILKNVRDFKPIMVGIEKGTTMNAIMPYLADTMARFGVFFHVHPLSHGNQNKVTRIQWNLQGRFENGRIVFNRDNTWETLIDELLNLGAKGVHDDLAEALSYAVSMVTTNYVGDSIDSSDEPIDDVDIVCGF